MNLIRKLAVTIGALASVSVAQAVPVLFVNEDGLLTGASNIDVAGELFSVEFTKGNCVDNFSGCDDVSDFVFGSESWEVGSEQSITASQALLDQVFVSGTIFGDDSTKTLGCTSSFTCFVFTPYGYWIDGYALNSIAANNSAPYSDDSVGSSSSIPPSENLRSDWVWAVWTQSPTSVPEPGTLALFGIGLLGMAASRRRKKV